MRDPNLSCMPTDQELQWMGLTILRVPIREEQFPQRPVFALLSGPEPLVGICTAPPAGHRHLLQLLGCPSPHAEWPLVQQALRMAPPGERAEGPW